MKQVFPRLCRPRSPRGKSSEGTLAMAGTSGVSGDELSVGGMGGGEEG